MSLVTPENVAERGGWKVTPLGRLIRPIRMRPEHPLPEPIIATSSTTKTKAGKDDKPKKKKRAKEPTTRARRQTIDPTKFGSQHLKGVFLENAVVASVSTRVAKPLLVEPEVLSEDDSSTTEDEDSSADEAEVVAEEKTALPPPSTVPVRLPPTPTPPPTAAKQLLSVANPPTDLAQEKNAALDLLQSLFGGKDDAEWGDRESLDSDIDMDNLPQRTSTVADEDDDIEVVPMDVDTLPVLASSRETQPAEEESATESESTPPPRETTPPPKSTKSTKLKDLFAPRNDEGLFFAVFVSLCILTPCQLVSRYWGIWTWGPTWTKSSKKRLFPSVHSKRLLHLSIQRHLPFPRPGRHALPSTSRSLSFTPFPRRRAPGSGDA